MAHKTVKNSYKNLVSRINKFPQGATPSELLYKILKILFSRGDAELISLLPIRPFTVNKASRVWKKPVKESKKILDAMAEKGLLIDVENDRTTTYMLPPPMAGFFEFSMMRTRKDIDQKLLAELFYQYINVEEEFIRNLFEGGETQLGRTFVNEEALLLEDSLFVLDYEKVSEVINTASHIAVGICYCRHKMQHLGKNCDAPMEICMTFNDTARSLSKNNIAREIDKKECHDLLQKAYDYNLVQFGENVRKKVSFICNCCACCCEAMIAAREFAFLNPVHTTNFLPEVNDKKCTGCGKCVDVCPVEALTLVSSNDATDSEAKIAKLNDSICLGCGLCAKNCPNNSIKLIKRSERVITPVNSAHRVVNMAIERGKLQNLIFDKAIWNHRAMAAILGVILKLPPIKQIMASKQMKSKYLDKLFNKVK